MALCALADRIPFGAPRRGGDRCITWPATEADALLALADVAGQPAVSSWSAYMAASNASHTGANSPATSMP